MRMPYIQHQLQFEYMYIIPHTKIPSSRFCQDNVVVLVEFPQRHPMELLSAL